MLTLSKLVLAKQWPRNNVAGTEGQIKNRSDCGPGSAWSLVANLLGFASLVFVSAKPLQQFGISGAIAAVLAMICAYLLFPPFLRSAQARKGRDMAIRRRAEQFFTKRHLLIALGTLLAAAALTPCLG